MFMKDLFKMVWKLCEGLISNGHKCPQTRRRVDSRAGHENYWGVNAGKRVMSNPETAESKSAVQDFADVNFYRGEQHKDLSCLTHEIHLQGMNTLRT